MDNISKSLLRKLKLKQRLTYPQVLISLEKDSILNNLKLILNKNALIGVYSAINNEYDLISGLSEYNLALPRILNANTMVFNEISYPLILNKYKILESGNLEVCFPDVYIIPLLAFNLSGFRIGYGGGYYDRYLHEHEGLKIGVAGEYMLEDFNCDIHDVKLDIIVTPSRIIYFI